MPLHHLMVGTWTPPGAIFTFAFDDVALTLDLVCRTAIPHDEPISWMAFGVRLPRFPPLSSPLPRLTRRAPAQQPGKRNIYGAAMKKWSSFRVHSPTSIVHQVSHPLVHDRMFLLPPPPTCSRARHKLTSTPPSIV